MELRRRVLGIGFICVASLCAAGQLLVLYRWIIPRRTATAWTPNSGAPSRERVRWGRKTVSIALICAAALFLGGFFALEHVWTIHLAAVGPSFELPAGPLGQLIAATETARLNGRAELRSGKFRLDSAAGSYVVTVPRRKGGVSLNISATVTGGNTPGSTRWTPDLQQIGAQFSEPLEIRMPNGIQTTLSDLTRKPGDVEVTARYKLELARTMSQLYAARGFSSTTRVSGKSALSLLTSAEIYYFTAVLRDGAIVNAERQKLVIGPQSKLELRKVIVHPDEGKVAGDFSLDATVRNWRWGTYGLLARTCAMLRASGSR
jgi:hypothetical protein